MQDSGSLGRFYCLFAGGGTPAKRLKSAGEKKSKTTTPVSVEGEKQVSQLPRDFSLVGSFVW